MEEISRILSARNHFEALGIPIGLSAAATVRRQYKLLAVRVHPDKNREPRATDAADAFKRVSEAYECLSVEQSLRGYLNALQGLSGEASRPQKSARPHTAEFPKKRSAKKRPPPPPEPPATETPRWRTPEEVWAQFQREEEEFARREFHERGFIRNFEDAKACRRKASAQDANEQFQTRLSPDVESRARDWTAWKRARTSSPQEKLETTSGCRVKLPAGDGGASLSCLLCRRKFSHPAALLRHEKESELHKANLQGLVDHSIPTRQDTRGSTTP